MGLSPAVLNRLLVTDRPEASGSGQITDEDEEPSPFEFEFEVDSPQHNAGAAPSPKEVLLDPVFDDDDLPEVHHPHPHRFRVRLLSESTALQQQNGSPIAASPLSVSEMLRSRGDTPPTARDHRREEVSPAGSDRRVVKRGLGDAVTAEYVFSGKCCLWLCWWQTDRQATKHVPCRTSSCLCRMSSRPHPVRLHLTRRCRSQTQTIPKMTTTTTMTA